MTETISTTADERARCRATIAAWMRAALRSSRKSRPALEIALGKGPQWLSNRLSKTPHVTFWADDLQKIAHVLKVQIPPEIMAAAEKARGQRGGARGAQRLNVDESALAQAGSAAAEMRLLVEAACRARGSMDRIRDERWVKERFGIDQAEPSTLQEIGVREGVTRERVRQVESRVLELASRAAAGRKLPLLASVHTRVLESAGMPWTGMEEELRPFLGGARLAEAVRFLEAVQPPDQRVETDHVLTFGSHHQVKVVSHDAAAVRLTRQVSSALGKICSYAGAALVNDVRVLIEAQRKVPVPRVQLLRTIEALPDVEWLDDNRRWCWLASQSISPLLTRAAVILTIARAPVDMETLYAGLVREARRETQSEASAYSDPVPPSHIVHAMLMRHQSFRRTTANAFTYAAPLDLDTTLDPARRRIVALLDSLGGIASRADLYNLAKDPVAPIPRNSFSVYLYLFSFLERCGEGLWKLRGRPILEEDRKAALARQGSSAKVIRSFAAGAPPPDQWTLTLKVSAAMRKNVSVYLPPRQMPRGVGGSYRSSSGHEIFLRQDRHSDRLVQLTAELKALIRDPAVAAIRFVFDRSQSTLDYEAATANLQPSDDDAI